MPELKFQVLGAKAVQAAAPTIAFDLEISCDAPVQSVILNCQIQIEAARRRYATAEHAPLRDLFGEPERWSQTLRPLLWTNLTTNVPAFSGSLCMQLLVPCSFDLNVTATKYFDGLEGGTAPVTVLFSGTVFYRNSAGQLQTAPISWNSEARFAFPVEIWKKCIDLHHPNTAWLALRRDVYERLYEFKVLHGLATFDEAIESVLEVKA